jgi:hypothetical protein
MIGGAENSAGVVHVVRVCARWHDRRGQVSTKAAAWTASEFTCVASSAWQRLLPCVDFN